MPESPLPVAAHQPLQPAVAPASYASCVVLTDGTETVYYRAGSGAPVVVLGPPRRLGAALLDALPRRFRVFVPELPPSSASFCDWLRGFLDGLGLANVCIIAEAEFGIAALGFALIEPDRVGRLVLTGPHVPDLAVPVRGMPDGRTSAGHPLLILSHDGADTAQDSIDIEQVIAFAGGDPPA